MGYWRPSEDAPNRWFKACEKCVAPKRHIGCHGTCEEYLGEKKRWEEIKEAANVDIDARCYAYSGTTKRKDKAAMAGKRRVRTRRNYD